jgi:Ca-activated chloride channel homolog
VSFAAPLWLAAGAAAVALAALLWRAADRRRRADLERFAAGRLLGELTASVSWTRRRAKRALVAAGIVLAFAALARPQAGFDWQETHRRGIDVMIALDVSRSMLAEDVVPNRLERAKLGVVDLMERVGGDRLGLIAFAGTAFLQCPLTLDHDAFREALDALGPGIIPAPGTDLASALRVARDAFRTEAKNVKLLVVLSDGEDLRGDAVAAAREVAADGVRVYTVGVGTPAGELIPVPGRGGRTDFVKDPNGQIVRSRLDEETLRQVADATGGFHVPLGQRAEGVTAVYERALAPIPKEELASRMRRVPRERYQWPLAAALLCLVLEPLVGERRGRRAWRAWPARRAAATAAAALLVLAAAAHASPQSAGRLYDTGDYEQALQEYRTAAEANPGDPRLDLNHGAAAYRTGAFDEAAGAFARALGSDDPALQQRSFYNLGNTQFRLGQKTRATNPQQTVGAWRQALDAYDSALKLDAGDADARFNRDLVAKELEKLQQEQQEKKKQQGKQDQRKQDQQQQQDRQQQSQAQQDQQRQDQQDQRQQGQAQQGQQPQDQQQADQGQPRQQQAGNGGRQDDQQAKNEPGHDGQSEAQGADRKPSAEKPDDAAKAAKPDATPQPAGEPQRAQAGTPQGEQTGEPGTRTADADADAHPGTFGPREARALLDSLRGDERSMPVARARPPRGSDTTRDW